jgi:hypothetical protein
VALPCPNGMGRQAGDRQIAADVVHAFIADA